MIEPFVKLATLRDAAAFDTACIRIGVDLPRDDHVLPAPQSPLAQPATVDGMEIANRFAVQPMEGWDGTEDGRPSDNTVRRWQRFGESAAGLVCGGEAVAVRHDGRANPNQLMLDERTEPSIAALLQALLKSHRESGAQKPPVVGLQLTHSGRYSRPNRKDRPEPVIACRNPILDRRLGLPDDYPVCPDDEIRRIIDAFVAAAKRAQRCGFQFVDVKHCHGYLGHELLGAHTRDGLFGGSFENRTRYLREIVAGIRAEAPELKIAVRVSAFDLIPFRPDPAQSTPGKPGPGVPEEWDPAVSYLYGFGVDAQDPVNYDLTETFRLFALFESLGIRLVNVTAGTPYTTPHIQRPALYPPSDAYRPPEDPLFGVARQMRVCRALKARFPGLFLVGSALSYLQEFLPNVAQAAVREGWIDAAGLGRMMLSYPGMARDVMAGRPMARKLICRTFSDCTTAPRNGLVSGCYPLDPYYKRSDEAEILAQRKREAR
jgi:2,4-dienoyl-CoA reductase-like NADH-dependent reductase (Old Yellow Enzyme family)